MSPTVWRRNHVDRAGNFGDYCVFSALLRLHGKGCERFVRRQPDDFGEDPAHPCRWLWRRTAAFSHRHGSIVIDDVLIDAGGPGSGDHPVIGAIRTNWGNHHGAVRPPSCLAWLGTEAEIGQDRRNARPRWPCRPQRASVLCLRPADPCRRPALGRAWPSEPLALCLCRAGWPYMVMGGPPGRAAASGRGDGLTAPPFAPACASSRPRR